MRETINAKGLACPQPVILTKKMLETCDQVTVLVDNTTAVENINRFGKSIGCTVTVFNEPDETFRLELTRQHSGNPENPPMERIQCGEGTQLSASGPTVFVIASDVMGNGNDELGAIIMKSFIHTAIELEHGPDIMIFYNAGVKLTAEGSDLLNALVQLEKKGIKIMICGTCVNYFNLADKIAVGEVSNMYDIATTLSTAGRIVRP